MSLAWLGLACLTDIFQKDGTYTDWALVRDRLILVNYRVSNKAAAATTKMRGEEMIEEMMMMMMMMMRDEGDGDGY